MDRLTSSAQQTGRNPVYSVGLGHSDGFFISFLLSRLGYMQSTAHSQFAFHPYWANYTAHGPLQNNTQFLFLSFIWIGPISHETTKCPQILHIPYLSVEYLYTYQALRIKLASKNHVVWLRMLRMKETNPTKHLHGNLIKFQKYKTLHLLHFQLAFTIIKTNGLL